METTVGVRFTEVDIKDLENLVENKIFLNISDAVRDLTRRGVREELSRREMKA